jgi:hypothetical protein
MNMSTNRGRRRICPALIRLAGTGLFRQFQYLTVPLHLFPESEELGRGAIDTILSSAPVPSEDENGSQGVAANDN